MHSPPLPRITSDWWTIARSPDLGSINAENQQAVDFSIWRAADHSWRLGACVVTRLLEVTVAFFIAGNPPSLQTGMETGRRVAAGRHSLRESHGGFRRRSL